MRFIVPLFIVISAILSWGQVVEESVDLGDLDIGGADSVAAQLPDLGVKKEFGAVVPAVAVLLLIFILIKRNKGMLFLLVAFAQVNAVQFVSKKEFVGSHLPKGCEMKKATVALDSGQRAALVRKWKLENADSQYVFILGRDKEGAISGAICFVTFYATEHKCVHHMAFAFKPDGSLWEIAMTEAYCEYVIQCASRSFLGQFDGQPARSLAFNRDVNGVTGATISCKAILDRVNGAMGVYLDYLRKP